MRRLSRNERGLSEIVGTLMLVIIVVSAATLLAAFVASYQKQLQTEQSFSHDQSLESLRVLGLNTTVQNGSYSTFGFTLASKSVNPSNVLGISINGQPLRFFGWKVLSNSTTGEYRGGTLNLTGFEEVYVSLDLDPASSLFSFYSNNSVPPPNQYLKFDVYTLLQNDFTQVYLPPTALAVVSEINPSGNNPITLLDGSTSFQPGTNASIVDWAWSVTGGSFVSRYANITTPGIGDVNGTIIGSGNATFQVPRGFIYGAGYTVAFAPGQPTTSSSSCNLSNTSIIPTGELVNGSRLSVNFTYGATAAGTGCGTGPTTKLIATGVILIESASGEEFEISPALIPGPTPYVVTLTVTNSVGLQGTASVSYAPL